MTPPQVAKQYGINPNKVLGFIRTGELRATNLAASLIGRPRWYIAPADIAVFEQRRQAITPHKSRPRRKNTGVIQFF